ncbi:hypothetical protein [Duganella levis]|uniref:Uncharacterized protein n=1 Tax=Duganella levis TaxID=2692169 RepID=A0ABW9W6S8_9BURK|nr:hypothetical protein [Duganella levis]MYN29644.1 hypothetical protein [Duganella levis]
MPPFPLGRDDHNEVTATGHKRTILINESQTTATDMEVLKMKLKLFSLGTLMLCTSLASNAATISDTSPVAVANKFVDALQHQRYKDAATLFVPGGVGDINATEHALQRIDDSLGGLSTIHPIATLADGKTIKLEVGTHQNTPLKFQKFVQVRYVSTANDGQPVFYELNLTADHMPPQILSVALHFPAADTKSFKRANQFVSAINY